MRFVGPEYHSLYTAESNLEDFENLSTENRYTDGFIEHADNAEDNQVEDSSNVNCLSQI